MCIMHGCWKKVSEASKNNGKVMEVVSENGYKPCLVTIFKLLSGNILYKPSAVCFTYLRNKFRITISLFVYSQLMDNMNSTIYKV